MRAGFLQSCLTRALIPTAEGRRCPRYPNASVTTRPCVCLCVRVVLCPAPCVPAPGCVQRRAGRDPCLWCVKEFSGRDVQCMLFCTQGSCGLTLLFARECESSGTSGKRVASGSPPHVLWSLGEGGLQCPDSRRLAPSSPNTAAAIYPVKILLPLRCLPCPPERSFGPCRVGHRRETRGTKYNEESNT